jgi:uncharacterized protein with PQ loop repeat
MSASTALALAASGWAILMALSPLLQVRAIRRTGTSEGVSVGYFAVLIVGFALWVAYGVAIANLALVVPNSVAAVIGVGTIVMARRYRHGRRSPDGESPGRPLG